MKVCVGIPIYKEELNPLEIKSLDRLFEIDKEHRKYFITHRGLNLNLYKPYFQQNKNLHIKFFNKNYFDSIDSYNRLLLESSFYAEFNDYEYLLIYQPDAFIFKNELDYWCKKGYDYIGAPWFDFEAKYSFYQKLKKSNNPILRWLKEKIDYNKGHNILVGNGGFSLRKVKSFKNISKWLLIIEPNLFKYKINEDIVWSILVPKYFKHFKIPNKNEALYFSIETNPQKALGLITDNLPFGCHGWNDKNFKFWKTVLENNNIGI